MRVCAPLMLVASLLLAAPASAATFTNASPITIGDDNASPYPSDIVVSGVTGPIVDVNVTISGYSHIFPDDVGIVVVSPAGDAMLLMDGVGADPDASNVNMTFDDQAPGRPSDTAAPASGSWKPTAYYHGHNFPAPGPGFTYCHPGPDGGTACTLGQVFNGSAPNGTWRLFVRDYFSGAGGSIAGGWTLAIETAPLTSIASGPSGLTTDPTPTFGFSADKPGSTFACRFDDAPFAPCSGPGASHTPPAALADGPHTFQVRAVDTAGYFDIAPPVRSFTVDTSAPATTLALAPSGTVRNADALFAFYSSEPGSFACSLDGAAPAACTSPASYPGLANGAHTFSVAATDAAGNTDATPATASWTVDTSPLPAPADTRAPLAAITGVAVAKRTATARFVGFDDVTAAPTFECKLDKRAFAACASPTKFKRLKPGRHTLSVRAKDGAGNLSPTAKRGFRVRRR